LINQADLYNALHRERVSSNPLLWLTVPKLPDGLWRLELKLDGYRSIGIKSKCGRAPLAKPSRFSLHFGESRRKNGNLIQKQGGGSMNLNWRMTSAAFCFTLALGFGAAHAQGLGSAQQNMQFDQQFNQQLQSRMMQNQMGQTQLLQNYIQAYGPQLNAAYQQYIRQPGASPLTFEQFAYWSLTTMGGTNPGPALEQQQRNFQAQQNANRAVQQGYQDYNQGWEQNQRRLDNSYNHYDQQAVRGQANYQNPMTGQVTELPYGAPPGVYQNNQGTWAAGPDGQYQQIDPQGYRQQMNPVDRDDGDD
jgi:hypothetical protein